MTASPDAPAARIPRAVPVARVAAWYGEALTLFRAAPGKFMLLALAALATELVTGLIPVAGASLANMLAPLVASGLLYASLAADRSEPVRFRFAVLAFGARAAAVAAVIFASLVAFAAQAIVAAWLQGANLLVPGEAQDLTPGVTVAALAAGIAASLPVTFVPFAALFDGEGVAASFRSSVAAAARNPLPLAVFGLAAFVLTLLGVATYGAALLVVLPVLAAASYAAWKDVFGVGGTARRMRA
jgi:uncharacterized membrane protein